MPECKINITPHRQGISKRYTQNTVMNVAFILTFREVSRFPTRISETLSLINMSARGMQTLCESKDMKYFSI